MVSKLDILVFKSYSRHLAKMAPQEGYGQLAVYTAQLGLAFYRMRPKAHMQQHITCQG